MADGFLGRWSRRKQEVRDGTPLATEAAPPDSGSTRPSSHVPAASTPSSALSQSSGAAPDKSNTDNAVAAPLPTLDDVQTLTPTSDFKPFVAQGVAPEVKNAALKKLFSDPHYNVMDGLDIYIDDYSKPDPLPAPMLRKMVSAQFLNLFDEKPVDAPAPHQQPTLSTQAQAAPATPAQPELTTQDHAHTDLRLQPNHATGAPDPGRGTE